jgi:hypothetical protein
MLEFDIFRMKKRITYIICMHAYWFTLGRFSSPLLRRLWVFKRLPEYESQMGAMGSHTTHPSPQRLAYLMTYRCISTWNCTNDVLLILSFSWAYVFSALLHSRTHPHTLLFVFVFWVLSLATRCLWSPNRVWSRKATTGSRVKKRVVVRNRFLFRLVIFLVTFLDGFDSSCYIYALLEASSCNKIF